MLLIDKDDLVHIEQAGNKGSITGSLLVFISAVRNLSALGFADTISTKLDKR